MVLIDCVTRLIPGVLAVESIAEESHSDGLLEYPQYTRPAVYMVTRCGIIIRQP